MAELLSVAIALLVIGALFCALEWRWPALPGQARWRADLGTDLAYWFLTPLVTRTVAEAAVIVTVVAIALAAGAAPTAEAIQRYVDDPSSRVRAQPLWLQAGEALFAADFAGYWMHRLFHGRALWKFHAVHHSSRQLDWLSSVRLHPVNDVLTRVPQALAILLLGFPPRVLAAYLPFVVLYALLLHANVPWTFGPLRHVIASPAFHRWHHTSERQGREKNFAGMFSCIDLLFGTYDFPQTEQPRLFGIDGNPVPEGIWAQMLYPFRRQRPTVADA